MLSLSLLVPSASNFLISRLFIGSVIGELSNRMRKSFIGTYHRTTIICLHVVLSDMGIVVGKKIIVEQENKLFAL